MPCTVVNSQTNLQARLPTLPQKLPATQQEWTAFLNSLGTTFQILKQETHPPNVIPQQLQTFGTATASTSLASLTGTNCTPSVDATQQFYGGASLKVVISATGATLAFSGFPIAIAAATRWFCAFQIYAPSGCTASLTVATSAGHALTESMVVPAAAEWQQVWGLFDFRQYPDSQAAWTFTFTSTDTVWLDGMQMNAVGDPITFLPKFNGVQLTSGTASTFTGTLDGISDGTTYARNLASYLSNGRPYSYRGAYSGATTYFPGDEVNSNNNYYLCTTQTTGNAPPNVSFWQTLGPATLDALTDGTTYLRVPSANLDANRRGLIDFSQAGHLGKNLGNLADGSGRFAVTNGANLAGVSSVDGNNLALIDFFQGGHLNKNVDNIGDGSTYARTLAGYLKSGRPYNFLGAYSAGTTYHQGDEISSGGNYWKYINTTATAAAAPPNANWQLLGPATLDVLPDGSTYLRMPGSNMDGNRRGLIDFSQGGHLGKHLGNLADGGSRFAVTNGAGLGGVVSWDGNNRALIDFTQGGHVGKSLDNLPNGTSRFAVIQIDINGRPIIDFTQAGHLFKNLDNITNGSSRFAVVQIDGSGRAIIDFAQAAHLGKNLDNLPNGSSRFAVIEIDVNGRALIDFSQSGHHSMPNIWLPGTAYTVTHDRIYHFGSAGWTNAIRSVNSHTTCHITAKISDQTFTNCVFGFATSAHAAAAATYSGTTIYTLIDYGWNADCSGAGGSQTWRILEGGVTVGSFGSINGTTDVPWITYDGSNINYFLNDRTTPVRTVAVSGLTLYGLVTIDEFGGCLNTARFGPTTNVSVIDSPQIDDGAVLTRHIGPRQIRGDQGLIDPRGSIPPTVPSVAMSYTSTTSSITITWPGFTVYNIDGTTTAISGGSKAITSLSSATVYFFYPYIDSSSTVQFAAVTGGLGSPGVAYTNTNALAAQQQYLQANTPLVRFQASTTSSGTGGGGGDDTGCLHPDQPVILADGRHVLAGDLAVGDTLPGPDGPARIRQITRRPCKEWVRVHLTGGVSLTVTPDHRFLHPDHTECRAVALMLGHILAGEGRNLEVRSLELIEDEEFMVSIELEAPHLYFIGGTLSHNPKP